MRKFFGQRRMLKISLIILFGILLVAVIGLDSYRNRCREKQPDITAGLRYADTENYAQISCYTNDSYISEYTLLKTKYNINTQLRQLGKQTEEENDTFLLAWYGEDKASLQSQTATASEVTCFVVGGDYFLLHPLTLVQGYYFTDEEVMKDYCLVNEEVAWELFGSDDIVGRMILVNGNEYIIHGVFKTSTARFMKEAGNTGKQIYLSSDGLALKLGYGMNDVRNVQAVEFVLPNDLEGYAEDIVKQSFSEYSSCIVVDQDKRFTMNELWKTYRNRAARSMALTGVKLPFWENVARAYDDIICRLFVVREVCLIIVVLLVVSLIVWIYRNLRPSGEDIKNFFENAIEKARAKREMRKAKKHSKESEGKDEEI